MLSSWMTEAGAIATGVAISSADMFTVALTRVHFVISLDMLVASPSESLRLNLPENMFLAAFSERESGPASQALVQSSIIVGKLREILVDIHDSCPMEWLTPLQWNHVLVTSELYDVLEWWSSVKVSTGSHLSEAGLFEVALLISVNTCARKALCSVQGKAINWEKRISEWAETKLKPRRTMHDLAALVSKSPLNELFETAMSRLEQGDIPGYRALLNGSDVQTECRRLLAEWERGTSDGNE